MPGSEDLITIIDASLTKSQITETIAALQPLKEEIKAFSGISIFTKNTQGAQEFRQQSIMLEEAMRRLEEALKRIKSLETDMDAVRAKHAAANKVRTDQEIADSQRKASATRERVRDIVAEGDAYKQLSSNYIKATAEAKRLAAQYGVTSKEARGAIATASAYGKELKAVDASIGQHTRNVGNYANGIKEFFGNLIGMLGPIYLVQKAFGLLSESAKEFMKAEDSAAQLKNILNNLGRDADLAELNLQAKDLSETFGTLTQRDIQETFKQLYSYGKLSKGMIQELMPVLIDFAAKQRIELPEAADILTKSFEGRTSPALKEMGINFKGATTTAERFRIVMEQLEPKVRNSAKAFGEELAGSLKKVEVAQEELKVKIGSEWAPILNTVWTTILKIGSQIPGFFRAIADGAKEAWAEVKSLFGNSKDLEDLHAAMKLKDTIEYHNKQYEAAEKSSEEFRRQRSHDTLEDLRKELALHKLVAKASREKYEAAQKLGTLNTYEGEKIRQNALTDALYVKQLAKMIDDKKDTSPVFKGANEGGPGKDSTESDALAVARLKRQEDYLKSIANNELETIERRKEAYRALIVIQDQLQKYQKDQAALEETQYKNEIERIELLAKIRFDALNADKILAAENAKELEEIAAKHYKAMEDLEKQARQRQKDSLLDNSNIHHSATDRDFLSGKISKEEYLKRNKENDFNDQKDQLTAANNNAQADLKKDPNNTSLQAAASSAQMNLDDLLAKHKMETDDKVALNKKEKIELGIQYAKEAEEVVASFVRARYENELNAIQRNIDANNKAKEKETASIQNSTLSLQEKAAAQINLDARVNAANEALQRKQRDVKVKEAKFDREQAIFGIIANTALGVMKASPLVPLMIATAIAGAAELAIVASKPIPTYWTGVESKPVDGLMIVGEKGSEKITEPSGKTYMTPGVPTLMYGKKGTRITPAHEVDQEILSGIMRAQVHEMKQDRTEELLTTLIQIGQNQTSAMKKKQVIHNHIHWNPGFNDHINSAVRN